MSKRTCRSLEKLLCTKLLIASRIQIISAVKLVLRVDARSMSEEIGDVVIVVITIVDLFAELERRFICSLEGLHIKVQFYMFQPI